MHFLVYLRKWGGGRDQSLETRSWRVVSPCSSVISSLPWTEFRHCSFCLLLLPRLKRTFHTIRRSGPRSCSKFRSSTVLSSWREKIQKMSWHQSSGTLEKVWCFFLLKCLKPLHHNEFKYFWSVMISIITGMQERICAYQSLWRDE